MIEIDEVGAETRANEAGVHGGEERVGIVGVDAGAPEAALGADGFAFGGAEPQAGDADRVSAVYLVGVGEDGGGVGLDGDLAAVGVGVEGGGGGGGEVGGGEFAGEVGVFGGDGGGVDVGA